MVTCHVQSTFQFVLGICKQRGDDGRLRMTHKSIKDFLFDRYRSRDLFECKVAEHAILAYRCLELLTTELRRDPCQYGKNMIVFFLYRSFHFCP